jgi:hypothetical protein
VTLELIDAIIAKSTFLVPFEQLVDKIDTLQTPVLRKVLNGDLCLMGQYLVSYLFPRIAHVGSSAEDNLKHNDSQGEKVGLIRVVHATDDLG